MSLFRNVYYFLFGRLLCLKNKTIHVACSAKVRPGTIIGQYIKIGKRSWVYGSVGSYSYIGEDCRLSAHVGKFCSISPNVKTISGNHPTNYLSTAPLFFSDQRQCGISFTNKTVFEEGLYAEHEKKVAAVIGNDVWIGEDVIIKGGVKIGNGSIIAMGSVVTKDLEPYGIYAGVPARLIKKRFDDVVIQCIEKSVWWEKDQKWFEEHVTGFQHEISNLGDLEFINKEDR